MAHFDFFSKAEPSSECIGDVWKIIINWERNEEKSCSICIPSWGRKSILGFTKKIFYRYVHYWIFKNRKLIFRLTDYITRRGQQNYLVLYAGEPSLTNDDELTSIKTVVRDQILPSKKFSILHASMCNIFYCMCERVWKGTYFIFTEK